MDKAQLLQRKALLERKRELLIKKQELTQAQVQPDLNMGKIVKGAAETAVDPFLRNISLDKTSRDAQENYGRGREALLDSPTAVGMRSDFSYEPLIPGSENLPYVGKYLKKLTPNKLGKEAQGFGIDAIAGLGTDAALARGPAMAAKGVVRPVANALEDIGGRFLNFLIKPRATGYRFGGNPGRAVAKHIGPQMSKEGLQESIVDKKDELLGTLEKNVAGSKSLVDATPIFEEIQSMVQKMKDFPETFGPQIETHRALARDILKLISETGTFDTSGKRIFVNPESAVKIKRGIGNLPSWSSLDPKLGSITKTSRKVYGRFDKEIDKAVPESAELNRDISDLIGADKGIELGMQREQNKSPIGLIDLALGGVLGTQGGFPATVGGIAISKFLRSTPFNTTAGAIAGQGAKAGKGLAKVMEATDRPSAVEEILQKLFRGKAGRSVSSSSRSLTP